VLFTRHQLDTKRLYVLMTSHLKAMFKRIPEGGNAASRNKDPLPTFSQWKEVCSDNTRVTVRDMWGRVLCSIPRALPLAQHFHFRVFLAGRSVACVFLLSCRQRFDDCAMLWT
jgi:hypothetical protein